MEKLFLDDAEQAGGKARLPERPDGLSPEKPHGHVLACFFGECFDEQVVLKAARIAAAFRYRLTALFVESVRSKAFGGGGCGVWREGKRLAERAGAQVVTVYDDDAAGQIAEYAKVSGASQIVIGRERSVWYTLLPRQNVVRQLFRLIADREVYVIPCRYAATRTLAAGRSLELAWRDIVKSVAVLVGVSLVGLFFDRAGIGDANIITVYVLGVLLTSVWTNGYVYGVFASLAGVLAFNFLFIEPFFSLRTYNSAYGITLLIMLAVGFVTTSLMIRVKRQMRQAAQKTYRTEVLLETSQKLQQVEGRRAILEATAIQMRKLLERPVVAYLADAAGGLSEAELFAAEGKADAVADEAERERPAAQAALADGRKAGAGTGRFPDAHFVYLPVSGQDSVFAIIGIAMVGWRELESFEKNLILAIVNECGLALEKEAFDEVRRDMELKARQEALRANLLRAVSHDLRTPLTSISGNAGILMKNSDFLNEAKKQRLYTDIYDDAMWLISLVENLLFITRIENGTMHIHREPEVLAEVVYEALRHLDRRAAEYRIEVDLEDDLLMAQMDARLIMQVIINIVNNAVKYTPSGSRIRLSAAREGDAVAVRIADDGPGVPDDAKKRLFEMFYTADNRTGDGRRGLGLGLSLCRGIIAAHGGTLRVTDNCPHGAVFSFTLQLAEVESYE